MSDRLTPEREAVIRQGQPTDWLSKPWTITEIEGDGETPGSWQVLHESTVIATLPDWAGNLALWMAEAPEDIQALLAELAAVRAERDLAQRKVASLKAEQDRDDAEYAEVIAERDSAREALREACDQIAALESDLGGATARIAELEAERHTQNQALDDAAKALRGRALLDELTVQRAESAHNRRLGIEGEHYAAVHHDYRQGRDLPYPQTAEEASHG